MSTKIAISYFKAHCLKIIEKLQSDGQSIIITKRDKEIAELLPLNKKSASLFGILKNKADIKSDIVEPINEKWSAEYE